jgi:ATP-dependent Clp protease adaptor protein ClpS
MSKTLVKPRTAVRTEEKRPPLYKVILLNDDYTPREFVVLVLKAVFRMNAEQAYRVMITAHQRGACVIAVFTRCSSPPSLKSSYRCVVCGAPCNNASPGAMSFEATRIGPGWSV